ncbi:phosphate ABC transporter substrate-binding protein PstS [Paucibacter sp. APW11]|uniref:Phosphate-binding protein PstS n=1 Tax=Roseateles aquae TaxID=3077235 RepID=A0ABU3P8H8_9BURK|nr:phosphate ABC transporter substrate-binding protein PstS [Paucibacter sp. APW11]MDT8998881.1 phosphate ABC transporter substrate-binding protein PstS [Paucibacter sp. APW11]
MHNYKSLQQLARAAGAALLGLCALSALLPLSAQAQDSAPVNGTGASFPSLVYQSWAQQYEKQFGIPVNYKPTGSGDGVKKIVARAVDFGASDTPLSDADLERHHLIQLPMLVGGIVPVYRLPGINAELKLTGELLADMFRGQVKSWNDARIAALNPGVALPALPIKRVVRADKSGSTDALSRYLAQVSEAFKAEVGAGQLPKWPAGAIAAEGNDGMVKALSETPGGLAYVSYDRVRLHKLSAVQLPSGSGSYVSASEQAFRAAISASRIVQADDDRASLINLPTPTAWPITTTSFVLLDTQPSSAQRGESGLRFVYWAFQSGDRLLRNSGFAPLPAQLQAKLVARFRQVRPQDGRALNYATL